MKKLVALVLVLSLLAVSAQATADGAAAGDLAMSPDAVTVLGPGATVAGSATSHIHLPFVVNKLSPALSCLSVTPAFQAAPAGSSVQFRLEVRAPCQRDVLYTYQAQELPAGWGAEFLHDAAPYNTTLVLTTAGSTSPGRYPVRVSAIPDAGISTSTALELEVVPCVESQTGELTRAIQSNLVTLITMGKPAIEHGLLIPVQLCGDSPDRHLLATLIGATSEAGTPMATPPHFYVYRSWVWPEPESIMGHGGAVPAYLNVQLPRVENVGWELLAEVRAGLYLLVFERDRYGSSPDPAAIPAAVTYRLSILP